MIRTALLAADFDIDGPAEGHSPTVWCNLQPLDDRVLIQRIEEPSAIVLTDAPKGIKGVVLSVGPGKWHPGEWWHFDHATINNPAWENDGWEWISGWREHMEVKLGDTVLFNSKWNDFSASENKGTGSDFKGPLERPLPLTADPKLHLVREADIFGILTGAAKAKLGKPTLEQEFFVNRAVSGPWSQA